MEELAILYSKGSEGNNAIWKDDSQEKRARANVFVDEAVDLFLRKCHDEMEKLS